MSMRIGGSVASSHAAGMSALWHDAALDDEGLPLKRLHIPTVEKQIGDLPLPEEQHQLPDGYADPFARLDAAYDVAAAQMDRGVKGAEFLHGKVAPRVEPPPAAVETTPAAQAQRPAGPTAQDERAPLADAHEHHRAKSVEAGDRSRPMDAKLKEEVRLQRETVREVGKAASQIGGQAHDAVATAARREAERATEALHMAESLGIPAALAPMGASQLVQAATMPTAVASAVTAAGAAASAAEVVSVGVAQAMSDEPALVRRALRRPPPMRGDVGGVGED